MKATRVRRLAIGIAAGVSILSLVAIAVSANSGDPIRVVTLSPAQAVAKAIDFAGAAAGSVGPSLSASSPIDGVVDRYYEIKGQGLSAAVDAHDGHILSLLLTERVPQPGPVAIASATAQASAEQFLDDRGLPRDGYQEQVNLVSHGDSSEFVVTWQRFVGSVEVPDSRTIGVDAGNGLVFRYADTQRAFSSPPPPQVDQRTAINEALAATNLMGPVQVDGAQLLVDFSPEGAQRLVWHVALSSSVSVSAGGGPSYRAHELYEVDAISGATVLMAVS